MEKNLLLFILNVSSGVTYGGEGVQNAPWQAKSKIHAPT